ncbi:Hypothetical predicted protein [Paramuricea clavata]|uniref:Uncharacterized protein n=1 Tax=Paramuricea clavata TaxID=317549 RepID=A0A6S7GBM9_PARCT|nr:Hypothetical predicted protein [Paramuricea clavata]
MGDSSSDDGLLSNVELVDQDNENMAQASTPSHKVSQIEPVQPSSENENTTAPLPTSPIEHQISEVQPVEASNKNEDTTAALPTPPTEQPSTLAPQDLRMASVADPGTETTDSPIQPLATILNRQASTSMHDRERSQPPDNTPEHWQLNNIPYMTKAKLKQHFDEIAFCTKPDPEIEDSRLDASCEVTECIADTLVDSLILSVTEVQEILKTLDISKATGPDGIPAKLLKETASVIAPSLCKLFNKSLRTGEMPRDWKLANMVPIYKKNEREHVENYRPISLLSVISKVLERCILNNIKDQLYKSIPACQHGYLTGKSCVTNLLEALDHVGSLLDHGEQIDLVYLDMSKAFDMVSHNRLIQKLYKAGFSGNLLKWFRSYLSERRQRVTVMGATSDELPVTSGVPQGSILGPVFFLLYVSDLPKLISNSRATMADGKVTKVLMDMFGFLSK